MIGIDDLSVEFGSTVAIDRLTLSILPGVTGLFGPNASGKSTLLRTLAGFVRPTGGLVTWDGIPLSLRDESRRRSIGWAGHDAGLYGALTVAENLELFARLYDVPAQRAVAVADAVGLGPRFTTRVGVLSAGYLRRAAIARALLHAPRLLLLDEPYANLDDDAADMVTNAIVQWKETTDEGICIVASHGAKRVKAYADASLIMKRGTAVSYRVRRDIVESR